MIIGADYRGWTWAATVLSDLRSTAAHQPAGDWEKQVVVAVLAEIISFHYREGLQIENFECETQEKNEEIFSSGLFAPGKRYVLSYIFGDF